MRYPRLLRRRLIPDELTALDNDQILHYDGRLLITKWQALKPRNDFTRGASCYYIDDCFKISKMMTKDNKLLYYYFDIIETQKAPGTLVFTDLLFDVVVGPDGLIRVLDLGEGADALAEGLITPGQIGRALGALDRLLKRLYTGDLPMLAKPIEGV